MTDGIDCEPVKSVAKTPPGRRPSATNDETLAQRKCADQVRWLENSVFDPNGRLFWFDGHLCRAMKTFERGYYERLLDVVAGSSVLTKGMVTTKLIDLAIDRSTVVLEHEVIHPFLKPVAWSSSMFHDAAIGHCDVHLELAKSGFALQDAHPWNVVFKHAVPVFVDFGSVIPCDGRGLARLRNEYTNYLVHPLFLMSIGETEKARRYLRGSNPPLDRRDLLGYFGFRRGIDFARRSAVAWIGSKRGPVKMLEGLREQLCALTPPTRPSVWTGYHDDEDRREKPDWHAKQRNMERIVSQIRPQTVLDVGCATGWYAVSAAEVGCRVVALDDDDQMVNTVYRLAQERGLSITPCRGDLFSRENPLEGCEFELVQALAIVHHLYFTQRLSFDVIARLLSVHASTWLVTEFVNHGDTFVQRQPADLREGYTLDMYVSALARFFKRIERFSSSSDNRTLLLCQK